MHQPTATPVAAAVADVAGTSTTKGTKPTVRNPAPPELADVALIDAPRIAAAACMSLSSWHELVRTGQAPQPVIRAPRCTRWALAEIRAWLTARVERGSDPQAARFLVTNARRASRAAQVKRQAAQQPERVGE